jgi:ribosomal protein L7/L12/ribosomal protein L40E
LVETHKPSIQMPICPFCEQDNPADADRCGKCGAALTTIEEARDDERANAGSATDGAIGPAGQDRPIDKVVGELLGSGRKMEAIKLYRDRTGAGLAEAKEAVEAIERGDEIPPAKTAGSAVDPFTPPLEQLLRDDKKIAVIKLYRERTGKGLKESKDAVEEFARQRGIPMKPIGCAANAILLLAAIMIAAAYMLAR